MEIYRTNKVFTPSSPAIDTFIERQAIINSQLVDALNTPGKQIILYGHSGCGKTTLIMNKLNQTYENAITTRCMRGTTMENIIYDAFDQLGKYYSTSSSTTKFNIAPEISLSYNDIKASFSLIEFDKSKTVTQKDLLPPQLTPQRLGRFFGESNCCWILEDFHKMSSQEKTKASQIMKVFMDMSAEYPDLKLIAIGAVGTARQVIAYDREMNNRIAEVLVPYMESDEIELIIIKGEKLLNLQFSREVKEKIIQFSCGLPSICHQLCLNMCFNKNILETPKRKASFNIDDLEDAIEKFIKEKSDTLKADFDRAIKTANSHTQNIPKEILIASFKVNQDEFSFNDIKSKLTSKCENKLLEEFLSELCTSERGEILVHDENSNKYRFNNLFLKNYALMRLREEKTVEAPKTQREKKIIEQLLRIIEKDIADDYGVFINEL
ncbi:MAG: hypothetical protein R2825_15835 [Saprospiraceae bacterium]